jgi:hypothetical protein
MSNDNIYIIGEYIGDYYKDGNTFYGMEFTAEEVIDTISTLNKLSRDSDEDDYFISVDEVIDEDADEYHTCFIVYKGELITDVDLEDFIHQNGWDGSDSE